MDKRIGLAGISAHKALLHAQKNIDIISIEDRNDEDLIIPFRRYHQDVEPIIVQGTHNRESARNLKRKGVKKNQFINKHFNPKTK